MSNQKKDTLGSVISISKGKKHNLTEEPSGKAKRLIAIDDLRNDNLVRYTEDLKGTEVTPSDVMIAWDGANAGTIGYGKAGFIGSTIARIRIKDQKQLHTQFLGMYLQSKFDYLQKTATGATIPHISRNALEKIPLPKVCLNDQVRIAHLLSKVERLIIQRKQHLIQMDELQKSVFLEMFGDPIINPKGFPIKKLSDFFVNPKNGTKCGPFGSALKKDEFVLSGVPVWNMDNIDAYGKMVMPFRMWITQEKYEVLKSYSVIDGDIIISRAGTVGKMCIAKMGGTPSIISTNLIRLRLGSDLLPLHFVSLMTFCKGRVGRLKTGPDGAFTHMNTGVLEKLQFPSPPLVLQKQFAVISDKVGEIKVQYQQSLTRLENLYNALSQKAFKGELDLTEVPLLSNVDDDNDKLESSEILQQFNKKIDRITWPIRDFKKITQPYRYLQQYSKSIEQFTQNKYSDLLKNYAAPSLRLSKSIERINRPLRELEKANKSLQNLEKVMQPFRQIEKTLSSLRIKPINDLSLSDDTRHNLLKKLFKYYIDNIEQDTQILIDEFWQGAQLWLSNLENDEENEIVFLPSDYDQLKEWVFSGIESGQIEQTRNTIEINGESDLGNQIILKKSSVVQY